MHRHPSFLVKESADTPLPTRSGRKRMPTQSAGRSHHRDGGPRGAPGRCGGSSGRATHPTTRARVTGTGTLAASPTGRSDGESGATSEAGVCTDGAGRSRQQSGRSAAAAASGDSWGQHGAPRWHRSPTTGLAAHGGNGISRPTSPLASHHRIPIGPRPFISMGGPALPSFGSSRLVGAEVGTVRWAERAGGPGPGGSPPTPSTRRRRAAGAAPPTVALAKRRTRGARTPGPRRRSADRSGSARGPPRRDHGGQIGRAHV